MFSLKPYLKIAEETNLVRFQGRVDEVIGFLIKAYNPGVPVGGICEILNPETKEHTFGEVVGFKGDYALIMPLGDIRGIGPKSRVALHANQAFIHVDESILGRAIDGLGNPIDGLGEISCSHKCSLYADPINPLLRKRIHAPLDVGVRALNGVLSIGKGQRVGIMAGSGVGKSVLLGMMARHTQADINVIALIGERGREVKEFIERDLGPEGMKKSVLIAATSDQSPLVRMRGAFMAASIAEYFREQGKDVLMMMDSVTRFAMAQREIGLAVGEPPTAKGYPPSVFSLLPKLLERAGTSDSQGSITGFYTVLVEGDDPNEPIGDAVRSIVDGHFVLDRDIAAKGHYPAIDVLLSASRVMNDVTSPSHQQSAARLRETLATYRNAEDLINIGAYVSGSNPKIDYAIQKIDHVNHFLRQQIQEKAPFIQCEAQLEQMFADFPS